MLWTIFLWIDSIIKPVPAVVSAGCCVEVKSVHNFSTHPSPPYDVHYLKKNSVSLFCTFKFICCCHFKIFFRYLYTINSNCIIKLSGRKSTSLLLLSLLAFYLVHGDDIVLFLLSLVSRTKSIK